MSTFQGCIEFAVQNCPFFAKSNIVLKEKQLDTLKTLFNGQDCISILPTGYGKSIFFHLLQWFAQHKFQSERPMTVLVVSPLNSLMKDHVLNLTRSGINACCLNISGW
jgi:superfamily II DNA helicase RecQ